MDSTRSSSTCHDTRVVRNPCWPQRGGALPRHVQNHDELDLTETGSLPAPEFIQPGAAAASSRPGRQNIQAAVAEAGAGVSAVRLSDRSVELSAIAAAVGATVSV